MRPTTSTRHRAALPAAAAALALLLTSCGLGSTAGEGPESPAAQPSESVATPSVEPSDTATPDETTPTPDGSTSPAPTDEPTEQPTDQPTEQPTQGSGGSGQTATLLFTGEVLVHKPLIDTALKNGSGRQYDFRPMFDEIKPLIESADLAVCHLELPVIPDGEGMEPRYAAPRQVIDALKYAGFDRCSTASNHILDRGAKGVDATLAAFQRNGMTLAGTASSPAGQKPTVLDVNGIKVTHLSYTEVPGKPIPAGQPYRLAMATQERILADVQAARGMGAEYVAVSIHDSDELAYRPTRNQDHWDRWLAEVAKVDLVVGTGSHVPEPEKADRSAYVLYGLGNLINWRPNARDSVIATVTIRRQADGTVKADQPGLVPTFTVEKLGYQVLDARTNQAARYDAQVQQFLRKSLDRVAPFVGEFIPGLG